jgi:hypothetical protein
LPDKDFFNFLRNYRGCVPNIASAAVHLPMSNGNWFSTFISPYKDNIDELVCGVVYSPPRVGGAVSITATLYHKLPAFF